ncbi:hypothetical protein TSAR_004400 [Trichomalopsis sarcophagae]|uniref:Uncharacterized protein n=1 Tax=Trichomalopsis sarcophagae TaxID=543379 RepID=A0A232EW73_9HYME|nr:hypothetical protein TSAR_004400 [Trichomalopsis sarcophagae]
MPCRAIVQNLEGVDMLFKSRICGLNYPNRNICITNKLSTLHFVLYYRMPMPVASRINDHRPVNPVFVDEDYVQAGYRMLKA